MHESPHRPVRRRWTRRARRSTPAAHPPAQQQRTSERAVLALRREAGETLGAYETRYDVRRGYGEERTIILP